MLSEITCLQPEYLKWMMDLGASQERLLSPDFGDAVYQPCEKY
jgi:hypothetical protein